MYPKINVKGFAHFEEFSLNISPFSVFSGQNGTGKTLLIKLYNTIKDSLFSRELSSNPSKDFPKLDFEIDKVYSNIETEKIFNKYIDYLLEPNRLLINSFGHSNIQLKSVTVSGIDTSSMKLSTRTIKSNDQITLYFNIHFNDENIEDISNEINFREESYDNRFIKEVILPTHLPSIMREALNSLINRSMKGKISKSSALYFPASREAYIRDYDQLINAVVTKQRQDIKKEIQNLFDNKTEEESASMVDTFFQYDLLKSKNNYSDDPYIEAFCTHLARLTSKRKMYRRNDLELEYFKNDILKSEFFIEDGNVTYKLNDDITYSAINASSLENEYSILYESLQRSDKNSYIIEEPEAHLSMINSMKIAWYMISLFMKGFNFTLSTHSTVIIDSLNYCYLLSKLESPKRSELIKKHNLPKGLIDLSEESFNSLNVYFINHKSVKIITLSEYGYIMEDFVKQIGKVNDLLIEVEQLASESEIKNEEE
ncbi:ATP-binding protein [Salinicoccus sp. Marseille-QA3877]